MKLNHFVITRTYHIIEVLVSFNYTPGNGGGFYIRKGQRARLVCQFRKFRIEASYNLLRFCLHYQCDVVVNFEYLYIYVIFSDI